jgi:hypothetical protein
LEQKKVSVGVMVHFYVQVQEVHHIVDLCCPGARKPISIAMPSDPLKKRSNEAKGKR